VNDRGEPELEGNERIAVDDGQQRVHERPVAEVGEGEAEDRGEGAEGVDEVRAPPRCRERALGKPHERGEPHRHESHRGDE